MIDNMRRADGLQRRNDSGPHGLGKLYPFDSNYIDINGQRMHYVDEGDGPPILMLHGNPTWSFMYRALIATLRERYRVIACDHIGCGLSDKPHGYDYTLRTHIDNATALLDQLRLSDVTLALHDWGGAIGFGLARRRPEAVRRFVLFNTVAFLGGRAPWRIRICRVPLFGTLAVRVFNGFAGAATFMAVKKHERMTRDVRRGFLRPYRTFADRIAVHRFVQDIPLSPRVPSYALVQDIEASLERFRDRPMAIFWGMKDFCFTPAFLGQWTTRFPHAEVHRYDDAGHYVLEDAHERIVPALRAFLERTD